MAVLFDGGTKGSNPSLQRGVSCEPVFLVKDPEHLQILAPGAPGRYRRVLESDDTHTPSISYFADVRLERR